MLAAFCTRGPTYWTDYSQIFALSSQNFISITDSVPQKRYGTTPLARFAVVWVLIFPRQINTQSV